MQNQVVLLFVHPLSFSNEFQKYNIVLPDYFSLIGECNIGHSCSFPCRAVLAPCVDHVKYLL